MRVLVMPKMPDFSKMSLELKINEKCRQMSRTKYCDGIECNDCALYTLGRYKKWKSHQKPKSNLIKWPLRDNDLFFVLPRVHVNNMPNKWKLLFLKMLSELFYKTGNGQDEYKFRVSLTKNGKYVKMDDVFKRY